MATPLAGEGPIAAAIPRSPPPPESGRGAGSAAEAPVLIFVYFHKAIRAELERMHAAAVRLATMGRAGGGGDVAALEARCRFLFAVYRHHCHAEDAVRYGPRPARPEILLFPVAFWFRADFVLRSRRPPLATAAPGVCACGIVVIGAGGGVRGRLIVTKVQRD